MAVAFAFMVFGVCGRGGGEFTLPSPPETATAAGSTHPTGMHSCSLLCGRFRYSSTELYVYQKCSAIKVCTTGHQYVVDSVCGHCH